jgi:hypothetical protein
MYFPCGWYPFFNLRYFYLQEDARNNCRVRHLYIGQILFARLTLERNSRSTKDVLCYHVARKILANSIYIAENFISFKDRRGEPCGGRGDRKGCLRACPQKARS